MSNDLINGLLEFSGSFFILNHCWALYKTKDSRAISLLATLFFFVWGCFNLRYYPSLGQHWSYLGGICIMIANCAWISLIIYYRIKNDS